MAYFLYQSGNTYIIEDKINPANFSERIYSIKGLPEKYRKELIEYRSVDIPYVLAIKLINSKDNQEISAIYNPQEKRILGKLK